MGGLTGTFGRTGRETELSENWTLLVNSCVEALASEHDRPGDQAQATPQAEMEQARARLQARVAGIQARLEASQAQIERRAATDKRLTELQAQQKRRAELLRRAGELIKQAFEA